MAQFPEISLRDQSIIFIKHHRIFPRMQCVVQAAAVITWSGPGPGCSLSLGPVTTLSGENTALLCTQLASPSTLQLASLAAATMCPQPRLENAICNQPRPVASSCSILRFLKQLNYLCSSD